MATDWKRYRCHKEVHAAKIETITELCTGDIAITFVDGGPIVLSREFYIQHKPKPYGYIVKYGDGYTSYSPAEAFEEGYSGISA